MAMTIDVDMQKIADLMWKGHSNARIASIAHVTENYIGKHRKELTEQYGAPDNATRKALLAKSYYQSGCIPQRLTPEIRKQMIDLANTGYSNSEIEELLDIPQGYAGNYIIKVFAEARILYPNRRKLVAERKKRLKEQEKTEKPVISKDKPFNHDRHLCRTCIYRGVKRYGRITAETHGGCNYILIERKRRGCDAEVCDKYVRGKKEETKGGDL